MGNCNRIDCIAIIEKYYTKDTPLYNLLIAHSKSVAELAVEIVASHPELGADASFVYEAAMLHDIGIYLTYAPKIYCVGAKPYIMHSLLGAEILRNEGLKTHALVCERHTGAGISAQEIEAQNLPLPKVDMIPISIEEKIVAYADKFFSKSSPNKRKSAAEARASLERFGEETLKRFDEWSKLFS